MDTAIDTDDGNDDRTKNKHVIKQEVTNIPERE
jgi:hypothetical protein